MDYLLHILTLIAIYGIVATSLNLLSGYTGLISVAHAAFFGMGAYVAGLLTLHFSVGLPVEILTVAAASTFVALAVAVPSIKFHDDYFILATFALQVIVFSLMNNLVQVTGGPMGLPGIPASTILRVDLSSPWANFILTAVILGFSLLLSRNIANAPFGRVLRAIREDEVLAQSLGKNVVCHKLQVFALAGILAGIAGALYAHFVTFVDPSSFTVDESIFFLSMVILGGSGSPIGPVVGAALLVGLPEAFRFLDMPPNVAANIRQMLFGAAMIACMAFRPQGLIGEFRFRGR